MNGFYCVKNIPYKKSILDNAKIITHKDIEVQYSPLDKFGKDKLFYEDECKIVLLDGVIFNSKDIMSTYNKTSWQDAFDELFEKYYNLGLNALINSLRGSFSRLIIDKKTDNIFTFTNHSGEKN